MKKVFLCLCLAMSLNVFAQKDKVTLKAGTTLEMEAAQTVYARDLSDGEMVKFRVVNDVKMNGKVVVPVGSIVESRVIEAAKSTVCGTKGRLKLNITNLVMPDGSKVTLSGTCNVYGKNRTPVAVVLGCFSLVGLLYPGTAAVLTEGHHTTATILSNTEVEI